ncbi:GtrA family protein [Marinagarivorans algicola]|uniref:GtrA family protein n=1 Tax=Marinagarivorans algicola TaxID=1513270 RepID=UPI0006B9FB66|nr:GtrA family protein [Marinagarivorans algicola]
MSREIIVFLTVGGSSTAVQLVLLTAMIELFALPKVTASACSYLLSAIYNYLMNYHLTFNSNKGHKETLPKFIIVVIIGITINTLSFSGFLIFTPYLMAQIGAVFITLMANFTLHKFWIYKR